MLVSVTNTDGHYSNQLLNEVADGFTKVKDPADRVRIAMDLFGRSGAGMVNMLQNGSEELNAIRDQFSDLTIELTGEQAKAVEEANDRFDALGRTFTSIGHQITSVMMPALAAIATFLTVNILKAVAKAISAMRGLANVFIDTINLISGRLFEDIEKSTLGEETEKRLLEIVDAFNTLPESITSATEGINSNTNAIDRQETTLQKAKKAFDDYAEAAQEVQANLANVALKGVQSLEDSLVGIVTGATNAKDAFRSMAQSIIADLARMAIQKAITAPLAGALGGLFGGKAIGGSVQRGRPVMVGERGAELFVPSSSGSIVSNKNLAGAGIGGAGITQPDHQCHDWRSANCPVRD